MTKSYKRITASTNAVCASNGRLAGFYVSATTSGTLVIYDSLTQAGTQISGTITPAIGWNPLPVDFTTGLSVTVGGTLDVTFCLE